MDTTLLAAALGATALVPLGLRLRARLALSRAKHPSLAGHVRMAKRLAGLLAYHAYDDARFFASDGPPDTVAARRRAGFERLSRMHADRTPRTRALAAEAREGLSDLQFTDLYRVPFPYRERVGRALGGAAFLASSEGTTVTDLDGNRLRDVSGSYGVNLFGHDFYKDCMERGLARVRELGVVLGAYHPVVADNVRRLKAISGLDAVSFHMSGTEAVMQAVRLARYHTGRRRLVRLCGAYHGWWGGVQPGIGNPSPEPDTLTLADLSERTLAVLRRRRDIACVLVNPLQALHPNGGAPADSSLVAGRPIAGDAATRRAAYAAWLRRLREVCTQRGIVLILDEVFVGFRLAPGGAQAYFGVRADLVTYGKTLGGGFPVGVVCGRQDLMRRYRPERPGDICFARGTFNSHPAVMGAMNAFLERLDDPDVRVLYEGLDARWDGRAAALNDRLAAEGLPVRVANLSTIWTVGYERPSRYNWMLQYYLRAEGLALSWVGTGRLIFSLDYDEAAFEAVATRFVSAARAMERDGFFWCPPDATSRGVRRAVLRESLAARYKRASPLPGGRGIGGEGVPSPLEPRQG